MYKQYLKQAWNLMRQNRFFSAVYILGTGLAISMVMIMAIVYYIRTADISPEDNRSRLLQLNRVSVKSKQEGGTNNWSLSFHAARNILSELSEVEKVSLVIEPQSTEMLMGNVYLQLPGSPDRYKIRLQATDGAFWQIFHFRFLGGKPFTTEEYESGMKRIVLSESRARQLFGTTEVTGKAILLNQVEYGVSGVVSDVSSVMAMTSADAWIPITSAPILAETASAERSAGPVVARLLAKTPACFEAIREEVDRRRLQYNASLQERYLDTFYLSTPTQTEIQRLDYGSYPEEIIRRYLLIALVFLLVPAINLTGLISSRMQERIEEMGVRKAFGARAHTLVTQVLTENLMLTCIGGGVGLLVSWGLVVMLRNFLFATPGFMSAAEEVQLSFRMLFNLPLFFSAFGLCIVLNLLSSLLPVWKATRRPIVDSINDK